MFKGPHYASLGSNVEFGKEYSHKDLLTLLDSFQKLVENLCNEITKIELDSSLLNQASKGLIENIIKDIQEQFLVLHKNLLQHLAEEEVFWPSIVLKHGEQENKKVVEKILAVELKRKGLDAVAFQLFGGALLDAMGYDKSFPKGVPSPLACGKKLPPWCSIDFRNGFLNDAGFFPRTFLFPSWHKTYVTKWKVMIDSVAGNDDVLKLGSQSQGCACIIA